MGAIVAPVGGEIHQREREIARHVDPAQRVVEFDAVEHQDPVAPADDIVEMQITVARAHESVCMPIGKPRCDAGQLGFVPGAQRRFIRHGDVERVEQGPALGRDAFRAAGMAARGAARRMQMKAAQHIGEGVRIRQPFIERRAACGQHPSRVEPAHAHHVLAGRRLLPLTAPANPHRRIERASSAACDERPDAQVQRAGKRPIERAFRERTAAAPRSAHEIDERETHRLDALVRVAPRQIDDGQMGFNPLDASRGVRIRGGPTQCAIELHRLSSCVSAA
ncbi:hypothetical protein [Burkholderia sp. SIMBA_019]|uniref:hypothetical protein n=1 Tax=Burkholderia sp. SIMBA_019 TaxID=3085765 RepID=UPI003979F130